MNMQMQMNTKTSTNSARNSTVEKAQGGGEEEDDHTNVDANESLSSTELIKPNEEDGSGIKTKTKIIMVATLFIINLLNFMDRYTIAGNKSNLKCQTKRVIFFVCSNNNFNRHLCDKFV